MVFKKDSFGGSDSQKGIDLEKAVDILNQEGLVGIPTETVYGLAANALNKSAVSKIFQAKNRPSFDPLIIHTNNFSKVEPLLLTLDPISKELVNTFWPGPMTLLLPAKETIPMLTRAGLERVGVRIPNHPLTLELLSKLEYPLAAPSANPFGYVSPSTADHVLDQLGDKISYVLDGGKAGIGVESTVLGVEGESIVVYRKGGLTIEEIEKLDIPIKLKTHSTSNPVSPGQVTSHYSPGVRIEIGDLEVLIDQNSDLTKVGILSFGTDYSRISRYTQNLSPSMDLLEAAQNLFSCLRYFSSVPVQKVITTYLPEEGLGRAINDRLKRAAANS